MDEALVVELSLSQNSEAPCHARVSVELHESVDFRERDANGGSGDNSQNVKKIFHFDTPRENYICDAAVVFCFDNRFRIGFRKFLKRLQPCNLDEIEVAGGAKCLASPGQEHEREFVLEQLRISIRLHQTKRVILMTHSDCGAYGGLAGAFGNDVRRESQFHEEELRRAARCLDEQIPGLTLEGYFVDFEGVWAVELERALMSAAAGACSSVAT